MLPGAPRGSLTTLLTIHATATQPSARRLTPWLNWTIALFAVFTDATPTRRGRQSRLVERMNYISTTHHDYPITPDLTKLLLLLLDEAQKL
jgi:hypothetical protein